MKKILFGSAAALLIAAGVYFNLRMSEAKSQVSDLTLANIEVNAGDIILEDGQVAILDNKKNRTFGEGCKGGDGACVIRN